MTRHGWIPSGLWLAWAACGPPDGAPGDRRHGPDLLPLPPVLIAEPDDAPIGNLTFLSQGPDGSSYITDLDRARVLAYSRSGRPLGVFGRPGGGPGEFRLPAVSGVVADSLLAVNDLGLHRLSVFDRASHAFLRGVNLPVQDIGASWTERGDTVVLAAHLAPALVLRWHVPSDSIVRLGRTPERLLAALPVTIRHGRSELIPEGGGYLAQLPTEPGLELLDHRGTITGFVRLPWRDRRGEPEDLIEGQIARSVTDGPSGGAPVGSLSAGLHRLSSGDVAVVYLDVDLAPGGSPTAFVNYRYYVSVVSADLARVCVDGAVPLEADLLSMPAFRGDTLVLFARTVTAQDRVRSEILGFRIDTAGCGWAPTGGVTAPRG